MGSMGKHAETLGKAAFKEWRGNRAFLATFRLSVGCKCLEIKDLEMAPQVKQTVFLGKGPQAK
jgi:hypothetical protein